MHQGVKQIIGVKVLKTIQGASAAHLVPTLGRTWALPAANVLIDYNYIYLNDTSVKLVKLISLIHFYLEQNLLLIFFYVYSA